MDVPQNHPLIGCSIINHPAIGPPPFMETSTLTMFHHYSPLFTMFHHCSPLFTITDHYSP